jgi:hypothetical protein
MFPVHAVIVTVVNSTVSKNDLISQDTFARGEEYEAVALLFGYRRVPNATSSSLIMAFNSSKLARYATTLVSRGLIK